LLLLLIYYVFLLWLISDGEDGWSGRRCSTPSNILGQ
jgi:hypothetical protein